jgi:hypothetical protein
MRPGEMRSTRMRAADGQWWSCDQGIDRYTHQPYTYWRPIYPDAPKVAYGRIWKIEEETGYMPPPPPQQPAIPVDVEHPSVPKSVKTACYAARDAGWAWDLRRSVSADGVHCLGLRARKAGRRVAMVWQWVPAHMTAPAKNRTPRWIEACWKNDGAWIRKIGVHDQVSHTEAVKELRR